MNIFTYHSKAWNEMSMYLREIKEGEGEKEWHRQTEISTDTGKGREGGRRREGGKERRGKNELVYLHRQKNWNKGCQ